jgi:hypothetical protein
MGDTEQNFTTQEHYAFIYKGFFCRQRGFHDCCYINKVKERKKKKA